MASRGEKTGQKKKVLFLCAHNSARSQMAEGLLRSLKGDSYEVYSAGVKSTSVDSLAVKAMAELGIDISKHRSKSVDELAGILFDLVATVCDSAKQMCPFCAPGLQPNPLQPTSRETLHRGFEDPALAKGSEEERLSVFRRVRDEIRDWIVNSF